MMGVSSLLGQTVIRVNADYWGEIDENDHRDDAVRCYGWTLFTNIGRCQIEMRNASNGYYGGSLNYDGRRKATQKLPTISGDF